MDITHQRCYKIGKQAKHMQQIPKPWASWEGCYYGKSSHLTGRRHIYGKPSHTCELLSYVGRHPHVCEVFPCMGSLPVYGKTSHTWEVFTYMRSLSGCSCVCLVLASILACGPSTLKIMECMPVAPEHAKSWNACELVFCAIALVHPGSMWGWWQWGRALYTCCVLPSTWTHVNPHIEIYTLPDQLWILNPPPQIHTSHHELWTANCGS